MSIPTWLSVAAILGCGDDENGDEQADTSSADDTTTSPTSSEASSGSLDSTGAESTTSASTTESTGATESTGVDSGSSSDTGELPDCMAIAAMTDCEAEPACIWHPDYGPGCVVNCELLEDEATCDPLLECIWFDGMCEFEFLK